MNGGTTWSVQTISLEHDLKSVCFADANTVYIAGQNGAILKSIVGANSGLTNIDLCEGDSLNLVASSIPGITYSWTGPGGFNSFQQNPMVSSSSTTAMSGTYNVTATINACTNLNEITIVDVNLIPAPPVASNNGPVMEDSTLTLSASTITDAIYLWTGPGGFSSSLQNPVVSTSATTVMAGYYYVTATVNGCTSSEDSTLVVIDPGVGIYSMGNDESTFNVFPNPASEWITIDNKEKQKVQVRMYNMLGEYVLVADLNSGVNTIDISNLSDGVYVVSLQSENRRAYRKICKQ
jgi:hypothetical protein